MPEDQWRVVIPDHHQGYIPRDQFRANRTRLADNRTNIETLEPKYLAVLTNAIVWAAGIEGGGC
jgi:hypothetical protein